MRTLKTSEAAAMLNVSANALRAWERRFGYPRPQRSRGGHRIYAHADIAALRDALAGGMSISSAIAHARRGVRGDDMSLLAALDQFELARADAAMESALALLSLERSVEEVLLPALSHLVVRHGEHSVAWTIAGRWARDWLSRARRLGASPARGATVYIGDATRGEIDPAIPSVATLELLLLRHGLRTVVLPVTALQGLGDLVQTARPDLAVIAGGHAHDDAVARWAYGLRSSAGPVPFVLFRRAPRRMRRTDARLLDDAPSVAVSEILAAVDETHARDATSVLRQDVGGDAEV